MYQNAKIRMKELQWHTPAPCPPCNELSSMFRHEMVASREMLKIPQMQLFQAPLQHPLVQKAIERWISIFENIRDQDQCSREASGFGQLYKCPVQRCYLIKVSTMGDEAFRSSGAFTWLMTRYIQDEPFSVEIEQCMSSYPPLDEYCKPIVPPPPYSNLIVIALCKVIDQNIKNLQELRVICETKSSGV